MSKDVRVIGLNYNVSTKKILDNIRIDVDNEKFVGIIGPNGSGKTSLLKHIYRALPDKGKKIYIHDKLLSQYKHKESARKITVMRQENQGEFNYTVMEIVLMGRFPYKSFLESSNDSDFNLAQSALEYVEMLEKKDVIFRFLSGGEKQRVLMARSIVQDADIILLDEPTNHLDVHYQWRLLSLIKQLGKTTLAVFHDLNHAIVFCDYIYVINDGEIVSYGEPHKIITEDLLRKVFRVESQIIQRKDGVSQILYLGPII